MLYDPSYLQVVIGKIILSEIGKPPLTKSVDLITYGDKPDVDVKAFKKEMTYQYMFRRGHTTFWFGLGTHF